EGDSQNPVSLHKLLYCGNNPVNDTDPSGLADVGGMNIGSLTIYAALGALPNSVVSTAAKFQKPKTLLKWIYQNNSTSTGKLLWYFSAIFQYRITDGLGLPVVGVPVTENVSVIASQGRVGPKPTTGQAVTDKDGIMRDRHIWTFRTYKGWVKVNQTI